MLNAERFKEEINKYNNEFGLNDSIVNCGPLDCRNCRFSRLNNSDDGIILCTTRKVKWLLSEYKEPVKLTRLESGILEYLSDNTKYMYIVRDGNGNIFLYDVEPEKSKSAPWWTGCGMCHMNMFNKLFQFVRWEDSTPTPIKEVLENCEVVEDAEE